MSRITVLALVGAAFLLPAATAQEAEKPKGPQFDELSTKLFDNWKKQVYHLGRAGVKKASCKGTYTMTTMGQAMSSAFTYRWDGRKGDVEWENAQLGMMVSQNKDFLRGLNEAFEEDSLEKQLGTAKLTAKETEEGTIVEVEGDTDAGFRSFTFDREGVLRGIALSVQSAMGNVDFNAQLAYTKVDGKYLTTEQKGEGAMPNMKMTVVTKTSHAEVEGYHVPRKSETTVTMGPTPMATHTVDYTDWKLEDGKEKPAETGQEEAPKEGLGG